MTDLQLTNGDVTFKEGDIESISDIRQVAQNTANRLQTFRGEWFIDTKFGPNYIRDVFKKNPSLTLVRSVLVAEVEANIKGRNTTLTNFQITLESSTRILKVEFTLRDKTTQEEAEAKVVIG